MLLSKPTKDLPVWARVVAWVGFPVVLALMLAQFVIGTVAADLKDARGVLPVVVENRKLLERLDQYQRLICLNTAQNDAQKAACSLVR